MSHNLRENSIFLSIKKHSMSALSYALFFTTRNVFRPGPGGRNYPDGQAGVELQGLSSPKQRDTALRHQPSAAGSAITVSTVSRQWSAITVSAVSRQWCRKDAILASN